MVEVIKFDALREEYYVERSNGFGINETYERLPLSSWGLQKRFELYVHVFRKLETADFEHPNRMVNYKLPITFEIIDGTLGKDIFLKLERKAFDEPIRDNLRANWVSLMLRDISNGVCQPCPMPNQYFVQSDFPYLRITVGKAEELKTKQEIVDLWVSKKCLGYFDSKLVNAYV